MAGSRKDRPWFRTRGPRRSLLAGRNRRRPRVEELEAYVLLSTTFTVTQSTDDGSTGTLSWAIGQVNGDTSDTGASPDKIVFAIPSVFSATIAPTAAEPAITNPVIIDGTTQGGAGNTRPAIQLDGTSAGSGASGLILAAGSDGSSVLGLSITDFNNDGILLDSASNSITDCDIGIDLSGDNVGGNGNEGVAVTTSGNTIGGTSASDLNVLSANGSCGVAIYGSGATGNLVVGNDIGTDGAGTSITDMNGAPTGNGTGVGVFFAASGNTIGGTSPGDANVISGNVINSDPISDGLGVIIETSATDNNVVEGNFIGTDAGATLNLGNQTDGVQIATGATGNTIGGGAGAANTVIFNGSTGVSILQASGNVIQGNQIGTNAAGASGLGNGGDGISITGPGTTGNLVAGNTISGNVDDGVDISASGSGGPSGNTIGGTSAAYGNVIAGNSGAGIYISGSGTIGNLVAANTISHNSSDGVDIFGGATDNTIGGTTAGAANVIGNNFDGVDIQNSGTSGNVVEGNDIGTDANGDPGLANVYGVQISGGASDNTIGGTASGSANTISDNVWQGVGIMGSGTTGNLVAGNTISDGYDNGVALSASSAGGPTGNFIGGSSAAYGNTITGNGGAGIYIYGSGTSGNLVAGNTISDNTGDGVDIFANSSGGPTGNTIGGTSAAYANIITSNSGNGIYIYGSGATDNLVAGNFIGTNASDDIGLGNSASGVRIEDGASDNTISGNVIASNAEDGVTIDGDGTSGNLVEDNFLGTDSAGDTGLGNGNSGAVMYGGASSNTISGNTISDNGAKGYGGVDIAGADDNVVAGNTISGNTYDGVDIFGGAVGNTIGGTTSADANTIASNTWGGVDISGSGTSDNVVEGNFIGTNSSDAPGLGNGLVGVTIFGGATNNTIGGAPIAIDGIHTDSFSFSFANTIVSNGAGGVDIENSGTTGNVVEGNFIGTDASGATNLGNTDDGVDILGGASGNTIGGTGIDAGNTIAANAGAGVDITDSGTSDNLVEGNSIGTTGLGNANNGVDILSGATSNTVYSNTIADNGTPGSQYGGITIDGSGTTGNIVTGNTISGNVYDGVDIFGGATDNTIGGTTGNASNTITDNGAVGVEITGSGTSANVVEGDYLGTDANGDTGLGNVYLGAFIGDGATDNTIGGTIAGSADTIAGNGTAATSQYFYANLEIDGSGTTGNVVEGDYIGTNADSDTGLNPANNMGIYLAYGASGNTIGGSTSAARNIISGNSDVGLEIFDAGPSGNLVEGNYIGTNVDGNGAVPNQTTGVLIGGDGTSGEPSTNNIVIDNVLSGNGESGIAIENAGYNTIEDNLIGTDADGTAALGNGWDGVHLTELLGSPNIGTGAWNNTISGNTIAANSLYGVLIEYAGSTANLVEGNAIGTVLGNMLGGVMIDLGASGNTIGGTPSTANVISGNGGDGVAISGSGTSSNLVASNDIGILAGGGSGLDNMGDGVAISGGATGNTVGGTTSAAANTIANNTGNGVSLTGSGTSGNVVEGNDIGTTAAGATDMGNSGDGVRVVTGASNNTIGGTVAGAGNTIAYNLKGVVVGSSPTDTTEGDAILGNSIFGNTMLGIDLADDGVTLNDSAGHTGPNLFQDFPVITAAYTVGSTTTITGTVSGPANSTLRVELFSNPAADPSGYGQGQVFLGYVMVTTGVGGGGSFTFTTSHTVPVGHVVSATATDVNGNTSEFAADVTVSATAPLDIGYHITGPLSNPIKHTYTEAVTLTNDGATATGAFMFVLDDLTSGVTLTNPSGSYDGYPYVAVGSLGVGQSVTVTLTFTKTSSSLFINYTPEFVPAT